MTCTDEEWEELKKKEEEGIKKKLKKDKEVKDNCVKGGIICGMC